LIFLLMYDSFVIYKGFFIHFVGFGYIGVVELLYVCGWSSNHILIWNEWESFWLALFKPIFVNND
jgi:hypothetical protein